MRLLFLPACLSFTLLPLVSCGGSSQAVGTTPPAGSSPNSNATITITPGSPRSGVIPDDFLGISLEASSVASVNNGGAAWLDGNATALSRALQVIGVRSIRIGGNSAERFGYPTVGDAAGVLDFSHLIGANLLWTLPVKSNHYDMTTYASFAASMKSYAKSKGYANSTTFLIGNESDIDLPASGADIDQPPLDYSTWLARFTSYTSQLQIYDPTITTSGPASANVSFASSFAKDPNYISPGKLAPSVSFVTAHTYPLGGSGSNGQTNNGDSSIALFLGDNSRTYASYYSSWASTAVAAGARARIDETNSQYHTTINQDLQHEFAASLWALDYLCYMAYQTNLGGLNLHNGPITSDSYNMFAPIGVGSKSSLTVEAVGYGALAFTKEGQGSPLTAAVSTYVSGLNLSAYALKESDGSASAHIVNKTYGATAIDATVAVSIPGYAHAQVMYLQQAANDVTAKSGITLGGAAVGSDGSWSGGYTVLALTPSNGVFTISVPKTSAAIVHFYN